MCFPESITFYLYPKSQIINVAVSSYPLNQFLLSPGVAWVINYAYKGGLSLMHKRGPSSSTFPSLLRISWLQTADLFLKTCNATDVQTAGCACLCVLIQSVVSDSLQPFGLQPVRLLCPWDFLGKNTGVGCHFLLQRIFLTHGWNPRLLHLLYCRWILYCWAIGEARTYIF